MPQKNPQLSQIIRRSSQHNRCCDMRRYAASRGFHKLQGNTHPVNTGRKQTQRAETIFILCGTLFVATGIASILF